MNFKQLVLAAYTLGQEYTYDDVVKSARKVKNDIEMHDDFVEKYKGQTFKLERILLTRLRHFDGEETEYPREALFLERGEEDELDAQHMAQHYKSGDTAEPIVVEPQGAFYQIRDGRHRARAAFLRGEKDIRAFVPMGKN